MTSSKIVAGLGVLLIVGLVVGGVYLAQRDSPAAPTSESTTEEGEDRAMLAGTKLTNFEPVSDVNELLIFDLVDGNGEVVPAGATISAHYTGALAADGTIFQSSHDFGDEPITFSLEGVIAGWTEGVPGMKVGGTRRLVIPAELAYGQNPPPGSGIPPGVALVFDIELVSIE